MTLDLLARRCRTLAHEAREEAQRHRGSRRDDLVILSQLLIMRAANVHETRYFITRLCIERALDQITAAMTSRTWLVVKERTDG